MAVNPYQAPAGAEKQKRNWTPVFVVLAFAAGFLAFVLSQSETIVVESPELEFVDLTPEMEAEYEREMMRMAAQAD